MNSQLSFAAEFEPPQLLARSLADPAGIRPRGVASPFGSGLGAGTRALLIPEGCQEQPRLLVESGTGMGGVRRTTPQTRSFQELVGLLVR